ncbi:hypothetical protein ACFLT7_04815 [candidate division KSB1 bacterium]
MQGDFNREAYNCLKTIAEVARDYAGGASELTGRVAEATLRVVELLPASYSPETGKTVLTLAETACRAKPHMAPFLRIANSLCLGAEEMDAARDRESVRRFQSDFSVLVEKIRTAGAGIRSAAGKLRRELPPSPRLLTYSRSSIVRDLIMELAGADKNKRISVIVPESRPGYEGRRLAVELADAGCEVISIIDGAISAYLGEADLVLIGADSISPEFAVNKIGSRGLAVLARQDGIPIRIAAETIKFIPEELQGVDKSGHNPDQVWEVDHPSLRIENRYFERIPLGDDIKIICEEGVLSGNGIGEMLENLSFCSRLRNWVAGREN